jgi:uncharacterized protein (DUF362 family)
LDNQASRRAFLRSCVAGGVALGARSAVAQAGPNTPSRVVAATDPLLRSDGTAIDAGRLGALLDRAMQTFAGAADPVEAWRRLVRPGQVVGLKVNASAGRGLSTNVALVEAIAARLRQAGIAAGDIVVWDRTGRELERAGFHLSSAPGQPRCLGTDAMGYEDEAESFGVVTSRLCRILTRLCDVVINVPVLKDHDTSGTTLAMKNLYGVIDNPYAYHANGCDPAIADLAMLPTLRRKLRFVVADLTTACYDGGPMFRPQFTWKHNGLLVGEDAVAIDAVGWRIIERKRAERGLPSLAAAGRPPRYIATAADVRHRLGTTDPAVLEV